MTNLTPKVILRHQGIFTTHPIALPEALSSRQTPSPTMTFIWLEPNSPAMDFDIVALFELLFNFPQIVNVGKVQQEPTKPRSRDDAQLSQKQMPSQGLEAKICDGYWWPAFPWVEKVSCDDSPSLLVLTIKPIGWSCQVFEIRGYDK